MLQFESEDADALTRALQPVHIYGRHATDTIYQLFHNILNSFKNECPLGFYTCMERKSRFPALLFLRDDFNTYDISFSGSVPDKLKFRIAADSAVTEGAIINIHYDRAGSFSVLVNDVMKEPNGWAEGGAEQILTAEMNPVTGTGGCGENNYWGGGTNILSFWIVPDSTLTPCVIKVVPRGSIQLGVRLEFTLVDFFAAGGVSTFVHRMASLL